ncbi:glycosyltransferase family 2 protein [Candidatus Curtissbacteria bacterium]|nr:glycosyltransferase family 2 protein [Candidatus Curtissbacteria bacterium]
MTKAKISALVLAKNEGDLIGEALAQLKFADEIIVLDQDSEDKTAQTAKKYTNNIITSKNEDFDKNRNTLAQEAEGEWLLYIDADERLSGENIEEIKKVIISKAYCAYYLPRQNYILGKFQKHGGWWPDYVPRLFKKNEFLGWSGKVHESPRVRGTFGYLKNPLIHKTARNLSVMLEKSTKWARVEAELYAKTTKSKVTMARVIRFSLAEFFKRYILKFGFLDGKIGLISALYQGLHNAMILTYLWEIQNGSEKKFQQAQRV